jgi:hypothetical protein
MSALIFLVVMLAYAIVGAAFGSALIGMFIGACMAAFIAFAMPCPTPTVKAEDVGTLHEDQKCCSA